ncbi:MAG TPA: SBBP repeat-containing protein, partial [Rhodanobacteraceae bacterium]
PNGTVQYSTYLGGHYVDTANAIAVDSVGNAYVAGFTCSYDFPTRNAFQPFLRGGPPGCFSGQDAFVSKLNSDATALVYSTFFGGSDKEEATAIALDSLTRAAIAGYTVSNDLPTSGPSLTPYRGGSDAFVARFDAAGGLDYSSWFGGTDNDTATGIAVGKAGDLYVSGYAASDDLPTSNAFQPVLSGPEDGFVLRFGITATSANIVYSTYIGGGDSDRMHAIAVDAAGNAYVTGYTESIDFPLSMPLQPMLKGPRDAVVASIGPTGTLAHSTFLGGSDLDDGWAIAIRDVPRAGTLVHVAGETLSTDLGTNGAFQPNAQGASDGFVARLGGFP